MRLIVPEGGGVISPPISRYLLSTKTIFRSMGRGDGGEKDTAPPLDRWVISAKYYSGTKSENDPSG